MWQETSYSDWCLHRPENKQLVLVKADYNSQSSAVFIRKLLATIGSILKKKKTIFLLIFLAAHIALERACLQKITFFQTSVTIDVLFLKNKGVVKVGEMLALTAITDKMFKTNFVFQIKRRTTGSFQYLHFCNFVLVLPKVLFREDV